MRSLDLACATLISPRRAKVSEAFAEADWSVADTGVGGEAEISILALPAAGSSPLTGLEARFAGGTWRALPLSGGRVDGLAPGATTVELRAVSAIGPGGVGPSKSVTISAPATAPAEIVSADWTLAPGSSLGTTVVTVLAAPSDGGSAILRYEARASNDTATSLGATLPASGEILADAGALMTVRAVNTVGAGPWSAAKEAPAPETSTVAAFGPATLDFGVAA